MVIKGIEGLLASKRANYAQYVLYGEETPPIDLERTNKQTKNLKRRQVIERTFKNNKKAIYKLLKATHAIDLRTQTLK